MKCKKCGNDLKLKAMINDFDADQIEIQAVCECGYYMYAFIEIDTFVDDEE